MEEQRSQRDAPPARWSLISVDRSLGIWLVARVPRRPVIVQ